MSYLVTGATGFLGRHLVSNLPKRNGSAKAPNTVYVLVHKDSQNKLDAIVTHRAFGVIIDVTGVEFLEARTAQNLSRMAHAARLLGAQVVLTGIAPSVAQVLVTQDVRLADVRTYRTLQDGIQFLDQSKR